MEKVRTTTENNRKSVPKHRKSWKTNGKNRDFGKHENSGFFGFFGKMKK